MRKFTFLVVKLSLILCLLLQNSCGIYRPVDAREFPPDPDARVRKNIEEGRGMKILGGKKQGGVFDFASSNELWRATLDTIDFMPLSSANYSGGIIITDWYSEDVEGKESIKITIRFLTNEIRSDAIKVIIHKRECKTFNNCVINELNNSTNNEIKFAILKKAAEIETQDISKVKEEFGEYKIPGKLF